MSDADRFTFAVLGAGARGQGFATWLAEHPEAGRVVAVAEPLEDRRRRVAAQHSISADRQFACWEELLARPRLADAVINTTMDRLHAPSAIRALDLGYHMLLEKPMAVTLEDCVAIDAARRRNQRLVSVCHSQRYHVVFAELKRLLTSGAIGQLVAFDHIEGVDPVHQSHSFVRGNWSNEGRSTFMLLSKSCHDLDLIAWLVGQPCVRVSSAGALTHFRKENAPPGAPQRCSDGCPAEAGCAYSVRKVYLSPKPQWYAHVAGTTPDLPYEERLRRLRATPYDRCAYRCDNDVVDHQVVSFEFAGPVTGTFTMTAFDTLGRRTRLHGTTGYLEARLDEHIIEHVRFADRARTTITLAPQSGGHGGADDNFMRQFIEALRTGSDRPILTGTAESLASHRIVFAAEQARRERRVVELRELAGA